MNPPCTFVVLSMYLFIYIPVLFLYILFSQEHWQVLQLESGCIRIDQIVFQ